MIGSFVTLLLAAGAQVIVESETFAIDWPSLDGWECQRQSGQDRIQTIQTSGLKLIRTLKGQPPVVLFDCPAHEMGGSKTSRWEAGGICEVSWLVSLNVDKNDAAKATLNVTVNKAKLGRYQCVKSATGEGA